MTETKQGQSPEEIVAMNGVAKKMDAYARITTLLKRLAQCIVDAYRDGDEEQRKIIADEFAKRGCHIVEPEDK